MFLNHHKINIACNTKTHLSNKDKIIFSGYNIYRADRIIGVRTNNRIAKAIRTKIAIAQSTVINNRAPVNITINNHFFFLYRTGSKSFRITASDNK